LTARLRGKDAEGAVKSILRWTLPVLFSAILIVEPALAFDYPLSPEAIREAYFLAKASPERQREFFEPYRHTPPIPETGPNVALIEVETPFACIVDAMSHALGGYHAPDAEKQYLGKPGQFRVHVEIFFTATYPKATDTAFTLGNFWEDFKVHLKQDAEIPSREVHGQPIYNDDTLSGYDGATIDVDYDVKKIDAAGITTVVVDTPDGQQVETTFSLNSLR
jgi:hypothetical protein